jgi:hypothetical protein
MKLRARGFLVFLGAALIALGACSDDDVDGPGVPTATLYRETNIIDPTPTTQP